MMASSMKQESRGFSHVRFKKEDIEDYEVDKVEKDGYGMFIMFEYENIFLSSMWASLGIFTGYTIIKVSTKILEYIINVII